MYCPCRAETDSLRALNHTFNCPHCGFILHVECLVFAMRGMGDMRPECACPWVADRTFLKSTIDQLVNESEQFLKCLEEDITDAEQRNDTEKLNFVSPIYWIQLQKLAELRALQWLAVTHNVCFPKNVSI